MAGTRRLEGKVAIVTGGGAGMGEAGALGLAAEGAKVVVSDIDPASSEGVVKKIIAQGGEALAVVADVVKPKAVRDLVGETVRHFGTVDILFCCAGVLSPAKIEDITEEQWDWIMDVNVKGVFLACQAVLPIMKDKRYGKIVIMGSLAGRATSTLGGAAYTTSKAAVLGLARHVAREAAPYKINVNAINPGIVDTQMVHRNTSPEQLARVIQSIPFHRMATPEEVANLVIFLASDESAFITGAGVDIHGGELII
jgi:NAD(P)-dependent dehydrogenase (short-subunit alcohol dehydrogenase family)